MLVTPCTAGLMVMDELVAQKTWGRALPARVAPTA